MLAKGPIRGLFCACCASEPMGTFLFRYMFRYTVVYSGYLEALFCWAKGARFDSCLRTRISWPMAISRYLAPIEARLMRAFLFPLFSPRICVFLTLWSAVFPLGLRVFLDNG